MGTTNFPMTQAFASAFGADNLLHELVTANGLEHQKTFKHPLQIQQCSPEFDDIRIPRTGCSCFEISEPVVLRACRGILVPVAYPNAAPISETDGEQRGGRGGAVGWGTRDTCQILLDATHCLWLAPSLKSVYSNGKQAQQ